MTDKDMTECDVISEEFPNAQLLICLYHTLRTFRREACTAKMGISVSQRHAVLEILTNIIHSNKEDDYAKHYKELKQLNIATVTEYFEEKKASN